MIDAGPIRRFLVVASLAAAVAVCTGLVQGQDAAADRAKALGQKIMCTCGCSDLAGSCSHPGAAFSGPCDIAKAELKEVNDGIAQGKSDTAILQGLVMEYGQKILPEPPTHGFDALAWTIPGILFFAGLALVVVVIRQWRRRAVAAPVPVPAVSAELLERARRQIERETED